MATASPVFILLCLLLLFKPLSAFFNNSPSAGISSTSWINDPLSDRGSWKSLDGRSFRPILTLGKDRFPDFGFGFFSNGTVNTFYLVVLKIPLIVNSTSFTGYIGPPVVLWSANRDHPVRENASLALTAKRLVLSDVDGTQVWSSESSNHSSVTNMHLDYSGNLILLNGKNSVVWQSFDYPTDTWAAHTYGSKIILKHFHFHFSQRLVLSVFKRQCLLCFCICKSCTTL